MSLSFTIITPCYNSSKWIKNCVESVANTNYDKSLITHLIVDDGSTDNTGEIVKNYQRKYPYIKYIKKQNGNWGSVINYVKHKKLIKSDYVLILDSDDFIEKEAFNIVNKRIHNADLFLGGIRYSNNGKNTSWIHTPFSILSKRTVKSEHKKFHFPERWFIGAIYTSRKLFYESIDLIEGVSYQDSIYFPDIAYKAKTIRFTPKVLATYWCQRPGNTMSTQQNEKWGNQQYILLKHFDEINKDGFYDVFIWEILLWNHSNYLCRYLIKHNIKLNRPKQLPTKHYFILWRPFIWLFYKFKVLSYNKDLKQIFR